MGAEAAWVPLVVSAIGAGATAYNTYRTGKDQDRQLALGIQQQQARQREADALVRAQLEKTGQSNPDAERSAAMQDYLAQIRRAQGQAEGGLGVMGNISGRYGEDATAAGQAIEDYATGTADIFSRIDAPIRQREREGLEFSRLGSDIGTIGMLSDSDRYLMELRMRRAAQRNPWLDAFGQAAMGYGLGMAGNVGSAAGAGSSMGAGMTGGWSGQPLPGALTPLRGWGP